jgi:hypothetical protein
MPSFQLAMFATDPEPETPRDAAPVYEDEECTASEPAPVPDFFTSSEEPPPFASPEADVSAGPLARPNPFELWRRDYNLTPEEMHMAILETNEWVAEMKRKREAAQHTNDIR